MALARHARRSYSSSSISLARPLVAFVLAAAAALAITVAAYAAPASKPQGTDQVPSGCTVKRARTLSSAPQVSVRLRRSDPYAENVLRGFGAELKVAELKAWTIQGGRLVSLVRRLKPTRIIKRCSRDTGLGAPDPRPPGPLFRHRPSFAVLEAPSCADRWFLSAVGADRAVAPGPGKPLTIVDSGLETTHPEFLARPNTALLNRQILRDSHGTAVASIAAAPVNGFGIGPGLPDMVGIYPAATLLSWDAGTYDPRGAAGAFRASDVAAGIVAASARGPGVINVSLFSGEFDPLLTDAIMLALRRGSVVVAAAGLRSPGRVYPASLPHVFTVAAVDRNGVPWESSNVALSNDVAAPGVDVMVAKAVFDTSPGFLPYACAIGTSYAAPIAAAAAAWVWTMRPTLDNTQIFDLMRYSAERSIGSRPNFDEETGYGLVSIPSALTWTPMPPDPQEPNDDIPYVQPGGITARGSAPLTTPSRSFARIQARLDITEDPEDVYRIWVPARRQVVVTVQCRPDGSDANVEVWRGTAPSVFLRGKQRKRYLLGGSYKGGEASNVVRIKGGRRGAYVYLDIFTPEDGSGIGRYTATITRARN